MNYSTAKNVIKKYKTDKEDNLNNESSSIDSSSFLKDSNGFPKKIFHVIKVNRNDEID